MGLVGGELLDSTVIVGSSLNGGPELSNGDMFGSSVALVGQEPLLVVVGTPMRHSETGAMFTFGIKSSGEMIELAEFISGEEGMPTLVAEGQFGSSLSWLDGDVVGDGVDRVYVLVGAPSESKGAVYVLSLSTDGESVTASVRVTDGSGGGPSLASGDQFGYAVASVGDLNGDGRPDIVASARGSQSLYVMSLSTSGTVFNTVKISSGVNGGPTLGGGEEFGASLGVVFADVSSNDAPELLVGATGVSLSRGKVYVLDLESDGTVTSLAEVGNSLGGGPSLKTQERFGSSAAWLGADWNGDGLENEVAVGAASGDKVFVMTLASTGSVSSILQTITDSSLGLNAGVLDPLFIGSALSMAYDGSSSGKVATFIIGISSYDSGGTNRGGIATVTVSDQASDSTPAGILGVASSTSSLLHPISHVPISLPQHLPLASKTEFIISIFAHINNPASSATLLSVAVDGRDCVSWDWVSGEYGTWESDKRAAISCVSPPSPLSLSPTFPSISISYSASSNTYSLSTSTSSAPLLKYAEVDLVASNKHVRKATNGGPDGLSVGDLFGSSVTLLSSPNRVAIGAISDDTLGGGKGAVYIGRIKADGSFVQEKKVDASSLSFLNSDDLFGVSVTSLGEPLVSDDSIVDWLGCAHLDDTGGSGRGACHVLTLSRQSLDVERRYEIASEVGGGPELADGDGFGLSSTFCEDLNGDGVAFDVAIGAPYDDTEGASRGAVHLLSVGATTATYLLKLASGVATNDGGEISLSNQNQFGYSLAFLGDLDEDGRRSELAVGAPRDQSSKGAVHIIFLAPDALSVDKSVKLGNGAANMPTIADGTQFGTSISWLGDVTGNGEERDIAVGASQYVYFGTTVGAVYLVQLSTTASIISTTIITSDTNGFDVSLAASAAFGTAVARIFPSTFVSTAPGIGSSRGSFYTVALSDLTPLPSNTSVLLSLNTTISPILSSCFPGSRCDVTLERGGGFESGHFLLFTILTTQPLSQPSDMNPTSARIGEAICSNLQVSHIDPDNVYRVFVRCDGLIIPQSLLPSSPQDTSLTLTTSTLTYTISSTEYSASSLAATLHVFYPVSAQFDPSATLVSPQQDIIPLQPYLFQYALTDLLAYASSPNISSAASGIASIESFSTSLLEGSTEFVTVDNVSVSASLCAGATTSTITLSTAAGFSLQATTPSFQGPRIDIANASTLLNPLGGTEVFLFGEGFGLYDPASTEAQEMCGSQWTENNMVLDASPLATDPEKALLWVWVGGRPCSSITHISSTALKCIAPGGITPVSDAVEVSVAVMGMTHTLPSALSYEPLESVTQVVPSTDLPVGGSSSGLALRAPIVTALHGDGLVPGLLVFGVKFSDFFKITNPSSPSFVDNAVLDLAAPGGGGANHSVSFCVVSRPRDVGIVAAVTFESRNKVTCTVVNSTTPRIRYVAPSIVGVSPSIDLDPLGDDRLELTGLNFGDPTTLSSGGVEVSVTVGGRECLDVSHVSTSIVRCTTPPLSGSAVDVVLNVGGMLSAAVSVSVLRVSVIAVAPRQLLPARDGWLTYTFSVSAFSADEVSAVIIASQRCDNPILVDEELLRCEDIPAPTEWPSDNVWLEILRNGSVVTVPKRAVLRVEPPPSILALDSDGEEVSTMGGTMVSVVGNGLGLEEVDVMGVIVGGDEATALALVTSSNPPPSHTFASINHSVFLTTPNTSVIHKSSTEITIYMPPGLGTRVPVRVALRTGLISEPAFISYASPRITSITPASFFPGVDDQEVLLKGDNFPPLGAWADQVVVGGVEAANVSVVANTSFVKCYVSTPPNENVLDWETSTVTVTIGGITSSPSTLSTFVPIPLVEDPGANAVEVGDVVRLDGVGMGLSSDYIEAVFVGGNEEEIWRVYESGGSGSSIASVNDSLRLSPSSYTWKSSTRIDFTIPPGVGEGVLVGFMTVTGVLSSLVPISYAPPTITSLTPSIILPGYESLDINVTGTNFAPPDAGATLFMSVGGIECPVVTPLTPQRLICRGLRTPMASTETLWSSDGSIIVCSAGQCSESVLASLLGVQLVNPPVITGIIDAPAGPGDTISLVGSGFGARALDVANVLVGDEECSTTLWESSTSIKCTIPLSHSSWNVTDEVITPTIPVSISLVSGITTPVASFVPNGLRLRPNPHVTPTGITAWRPVGQSLTVVVRWRFPGTSLETYLNSQHPLASLATAAPVTSFVVEVSRTTAFNDNDAVASVSVARGARTQAATNSIDEDDREAWEWFESRVSLDSPSPIYVRIQAINNDGEGEWVELQKSWAESYLDAAVPETCSELSYLSTEQEKREDVVCRACPAGSTCGGLTSESVTAQAGYWRVPWSRFELGFAECILHDACLGVSSNAADHVPASSSSTASDNDTLTAREYWKLKDEEDRERALKGVELGGKSVERCRKGHRGVLCSSCEADYYPVGGRCTACGDQAWILVRFFMLVLAIVAGFCLILLRGWVSRTQGKAKEPLVGKILLGHVQTVAIVGGVTLRWPLGAQSFFNAIDTVSSFSTSGLALECLFPSIGESPFTRTTAILFMPLGLGICAAIFWAFVGCFECVSPSCARYLRSDTPPTPTSTPTRSSPSQQPSPFTPGPPSEFRSNIGGEGGSGAGATSAGGTGATAAAEMLGDDGGVGVQVGEEGRGKGEEEEEGKEESGVEGRVGEATQLSTPPLSHSDGITVSQWFVLFRKRCLLSVAITAFLVHTPLTTAAFKLLTCRPVGPVDDASQAQLRLSMHLDYDCSNPSTLTQMLALGVPIIVIVSLGLPAATALSLFFIGPDALQTPKYRDVAHFLFTGFRRSKPYWEAVILGRKVLLASVTTLLAPTGPGLQLLAGMCVVLLAQIIHSRVRPYQSNVINALESFALIASALTLLAGTFVVLTEAGLTGIESSLSILASIVIITVNSVFVAACVILLTKRGRRMLFQWAQERELVPKVLVSKSPQVVPSTFVVDNPMDKSKRPPIVHRTVHLHPTGRQSSASTLSTKSSHES